MKTLYESLLRNTNGGIEGELREWFDKQRSLPGNDRGGSYDVLPDGKGYVIRYTEFSRSPYQTIFNINTELPKQLTGIYSFNGDWCRLNLNHAKLDQFDASNLILPTDQADLIISFLSISWSNIKKLIGLPKSMNRFVIRCNQSTISKIEHIDAPSVDLDVSDGVVVNLDDIKHNKLHRLTINGLILSSTIARRMNKDINLRNEIVKSGVLSTHMFYYDRHEKSWVLQHVYDSIIDELFKDNKIDVLAFFSPDDTPKSQTYFIEKAKNGYKLVYKW